MHSAEFLPHTRFQVLRTVGKWNVASKPKLRDLFFKTLDNSNLLTRSQIMGGFLVISTTSFMKQISH